MLGLLLILKLITGHGLSFICSICACHASFLMIPMRLGITILKMVILLFAISLSFL